MLKALRHHPKPVQITITDTDLLKDFDLYAATRNQSREMKEMMGQVDSILLSYHEALPILAREREKDIIILDALSYCRY